MLCALRRVAGGRTAKFTSNASISRSKGYANAVSLEEDKVRGTVEKLNAERLAKVSSTLAICSEGQIANGSSYRNLQTPDDDLDAIRSRLAAGETLPVSTESHDYSSKDPQLGDYPVVPWTNNQLLPPNGWWDNQARRNFGDPVTSYNTLYEGVPLII